MIEGTLGGRKNVLVGSQVVSVSMEDSKISHNANRLVISLPDALVDNITSGLKLCVVGRFFSFRPMIEMVHKWVSKKWKIKSSVCIFAMIGGLFYFKFTMEGDLNFILLRTWYYGKHYLALTRWHLGFDASVEINKLALVWVRLPGLPLEFWDDKILKVDREFFWSLCYYEQCDNAKI